MLRRLAVCSFALLVLVVLPALAETAVSVRTKTTSVAAFKNGLGFFVREGTATLKDGWATSGMRSSSTIKSAAWLEGLKWKNG